MHILTNQARNVILLLAVVLALSGCRTIRQYRADSQEWERNAVFILESNQPVLTSATLGGSNGRLILATAHPQTIVSPTFATAGTIGFTAGNSHRRTLTPLQAELGGAGDALIGFDAWPRERISVDYFKGLLSIGPSAAPPPDMPTYQFQGVPAVPLTVAGREYRVLVDTSLPETLVLPSGGGSFRRSETVTLGELRLNGVDVLYSEVSEPRIGTRLLARFLVIIDYGRSWVGLWADPRTASVPVAWQTDLPGDAAMSDAARPVVPDNEITTDVRHIDAARPVSIDPHAPAHRSDPDRT
jgi:hypothetical protein